MVSASRRSARCRLAIALAGAYALACGAPTLPKNGREWSPDDSRLVFFLPWNGEANDREIFGVNRDGSGLVNLTCNDVEDANPAWSPDGEWIAYFTRADRWLQIALIHPDGSGYRQLTDAPAHSHSDLPLIELGSSWTKRLGFVKDRTARPRRPSAARTANPAR